MSFFRDDPFFSGANLHGQFMMNDPFEDFYGRQRQLAIGRGTGTGFQSLSPFGMMDPFQRMNTMMRDMERMSSMAAGGGGLGGGGGQTFSQQSFMHFSHDSRSGEQPKVYQSSVSTRSGPGGVKETRKMEKDSTSGTQKTSIGHQIGERSHTINKQYNYKTKEAEQMQELVNLDEEETDQFDTEWKQKSQRLNKSLLNSGHQVGPSLLGLPSGPSSSSSQPHYKPSGHTSQHNSTDSGPSRHRTTEHSPRFSPYSGTRYTHDDTTRERHSHHCSQHKPVNNSDPIAQSQRAKKKKSSRVNFHNE